MGQSTQFILQPAIPGSSGHGEPRGEIRYAHQFMTATPQESTRNPVELKSSNINLVDGGTEQYNEHLGSNTVSGSSRIPVAEPFHPGGLSVAGSSRTKVSSTAGPTAPISTMGPLMEPVALLEISANRRVATSTRRNTRNGSSVDSDSPVIFGRNLRAFLNKFAIGQGPPLTFGSIDGSPTPIPSSPPSPVIKPGGDITYFRPATASTQKNPPQLPSKSAWARGPPQLPFKSGKQVARSPDRPPQLTSKLSWAQVARPPDRPPQQNRANPTPRPQSPAPSTPVSATNPTRFHANHARRPSSVAPSMSSSQTAVLATSIPSPIPKFDKKAIAKLFRGPSQPVPTPPPGASGLPPPPSTMWPLYYVRFAPFM
jgi:hypothetical protein